MSKNYWFTSDMHFGHKNIIKFCNRPFSSVEEMNEKLITNWNELIKSDDTVYHLGDFAFMNQKDSYDIYKKLNGNIICIIGNHDNPIVYNPKIKNKFHYVEETINLQKICMFHYRMEIWNGFHNGAWHLYGHSHGMFPDNTGLKRLDVGIDTHNYYPYNFDEIEQMMDNKIINNEIH